MNISEVMPNGNVRVVVPISLRKTVRGRVIAVAENVKAVQSQTPLLMAIGCGILWQQWLDEGLFSGVSDLAQHLGKERAVVSHTLQLALLSPEIVHLAIIGTCHIYFLKRWGMNSWRPRRQVRNSWPVPADSEASTLMPSSRKLSTMGWLLTKSSLPQFI